MISKEEIAALQWLKEFNKINPEGYTIDVLNDLVKYKETLLTLCNYLPHTYKNPDTVNHNNFQNFSNFSNFPNFSSGVEGESWGAQLDREARERSLKGDTDNGTV